MKWHRFGSLLFTLSLTASLATVPSLEAAKLVFTQIPLRGARGARAPESRLVVRSEDGEISLLSQGFTAAADPDVSLDGTKILFAGKKAEADLWNVYEINADGSGLRQITQDAGNCREPVYLSSFYTIDSAEPWYLIAFASDLAGEVAPDGAPSWSLYSCRLDGSELQRLTYSPYSDTHPLVLADGRILFSSLRACVPSMDRPGRSALFTINSDGTDLSLFAGDEGLAFKRMAAITADGNCVFVESGDASTGGGRLGLVRMRRNLHSYRSVTGPEEGVFSSPSALPEGSLILSHRDAKGGAGFGLYRFDPLTARKELVFDDPAYDELDAALLAPRRLPDGRSSVVTDRDPHGQLYALDVEISDLTDLRPTAAHRIRLLEGLPRHRSPRGDPEWGDEQEFPVKRILGEIPIEADGSFFVEVPANIPIQLQLVDERGFALRACDWIWVRNHEPRGCIGCHEDPELTPPNRLVRAVEKAPHQLTLPEDKRRVVDFRRDIVPILANRCSATSCHSTRGSAPVLSAAPADSSQFALETYRKLTGRSSSPAYPAPRFLRPGQARNSPLTRHVLGVDTRSAREETVPEAELPLLDASGLSPIEQKTLMEWIDFGAHWASLPRGTAVGPDRSHPGDNP